MGLFLATTPRVEEDPFDHPDFVYELKLDGFRALALVEHGRCRLMSRNGGEFGRWEALRPRSRGRCT